jgi:Uma2 family endonuclease
MSSIVTSLETATLPEGPPRKRWTRSECMLLEESGLWHDQHVELIDGELYNEMGKNRPHVNAVTILREWLARIFGWEFINTVASIDVAPEDNPTNEPEPDIIVLTKPTWEFAANPSPPDIRLVVEISDTTLSFDSGKKARLYARADIAEYWVLDIAARRLNVHRDPAHGVYQSVSAYSGTEAVSSGAITKAFTVSAVFRE